MPRKMHVFIRVLWTTNEWPNSLNKCIKHYLHMSLFFCLFRNEPQPMKTINSLSFFFIKSKKITFFILNIAYQSL